MVTTLAVLVFVAAYVLIATERIHRVAAAVWGAAAMVLIGVADSRSVFFDEETGIDWNVLFLLLGMMMIVSVLRKTGVFEFLAIWAAKRARGRPFTVMVMLVVITAVASTMLNNVTTVLLVAPVTLLVCDRLGVRPVPYLIAEAMSSNIGGTATLVGDPPNIIIANRAGLTFNDFLVHLAPVVVVIMVVFVGLCRVLFRGEFGHDPERAAGVMVLDEREAIEDPRLLVQSIVVLVLVLAAFVLEPVVHLDPSIVAMLGAGALVALSRLEPEDYLADVEWSTLVFFAGLFVMVGGLVKAGVVEQAAHTLADAVGGRYLLATSLVVWASAVLSALIDNIPYVATMAPVIQALAGGDSPHAHSLWWSLALGADLGGNATAVGASANVVILGIAARNGHRISFWEFTKYGLVVAPVTIAIAWVYVLLRYFAFA